MTAYLLLALSVVLSTGRNVLSKNLSMVSFPSRPFFLCQGCLFVFGGITILCIEGATPWRVSAATVGYAAIYGLCLILAQWFYTSALSSGNTSLCATVYSLGFIIPTLSGAVLWSEPFSFLDGSGILAATLAVIVSGLGKGGSEKEQRKGAKALYFLPLLIAMLSSGALGLIQKIQQQSPYADEKPAFLIIAFAFAATTSLIFAAFVKKPSSAPFTRVKLAIASLVGLVFGACNMLNTTLAGMLDSAVLFPTLNLSIILLSTLAGAILFKEKIAWRECAVILLGTASILLLNLG